MEEQEKSVCRKCHSEFGISPSRARFAAEKNFFCPPLYCESCFAELLKQLWEVPGERRHVVCAGCGKDTRLHFVPNQEKPAYCGECYQEILKRADDS